MVIQCQVQNDIVRRTTSLGRENAFICCGREISHVKVYCFLGSFTDLCRATFDTSITPTTCNETFEAGRRLFFYVQKCSEVAAKWIVKYRKVGSTERRALFYPPPVLAPYEAAH